MSRGNFLGLERCENGHQNAPRGRSWESISGAAHTPGWEPPRPLRSNWLKEEWSGYGGGQRANPIRLNVSPNEPMPERVNLWKPAHACPATRDGDYRRSSARYGKPLGVWKSALTRSNGFTFGLGADDSPERKWWLVYSPATDHERRTHANSNARVNLIRWFKKLESPGARSAFLSGAVASVQFRRLAKRYGLDGREPMKIEDLAKDEGVTRSAVERSIAKAIESLPPLPPDIRHAGLRAIATETVVLAEERKFIENNMIGDATPAVPQDTSTARGSVARTAAYELRAVIAVGPSGTVWASDVNNRPSLSDAYTDGWVACFEGVKDTSCPFRNKKLRKKWHQGYREAAQERAARREADISTS